MSDANQDFPYKTLGRHLRKMREGLKESLAEVAGSVEIDVELLSKIEHGASRPAEDILLLLISHFAIKEDEATKLWSLAGYSPVDSSDDVSFNERDFFSKPAVVVLPIDSRVIYTDMSHVMVNNSGVVINFMQANGPNNQPLIASRLGMSKQHAQNLLEILQEALDSKPKPPKLLPNQNLSKSPEEDSKKNQ